MNVFYSDFRQRMKLYMDKICESKDFIRVVRQRGENVFVIPESMIASMNTKELKELQKYARLSSYYEKLTEVSADK